MGEQRCISSVDSRICMKYANRFNFMLFYTSLKRQISQDISSSPTITNIFYLLFNHPSFPHVLFCFLFFLFSLDAFSPPSLSDINNDDDERRRTTTKSISNMESENVNKNLFCFFQRGRERGSRKEQGKKG